MESRFRESDHARAMFTTVEGFLASDLSQTEFCRQQKLTYWTFRYWLKKYRARQQLHQSSSNTSQDFIPLRLASPDSTSYPIPSCVIELPNGITIRFSGTLDSDVLSDLISKMAG